MLTGSPHNTGATTNVFDAAGRLIGIDYPAGASVRYGHDLLGRVTSITNKASGGGAAYVTRYVYDLLGQVTEVIDHWNRTNRFEYDRVGRRTKRTLANGHAFHPDANGVLSRRVGPQSGTTLGHAAVAGSTPTGLGPDREQSNRSIRRACPNRQIALSSFISLGPFWHRSNSDFSLQGRLNRTA